MNYIWDTAIKALSQGIITDDITFAPCTSYSPYVEVAFEDINIRKLVGPLRVEINPYYRFCDIFQALLDINFVGQEELRMVLFDIITHYLLYLDVQQGLTKQEYYRTFICMDIENNVFGQEIKDRMSVFTIGEFELVIHSIIALYRTEATVHLFKKVVRNIFTSSIIYYRSEDIPEMLIYLNREETTVDQQKIRVLLSLFLPLGFKYRLYWQNHFGLIGYEQTMQMDHIVIY